jgi:hypothetical protein
MHKAMPKLKNITSDEELVQWMGLKALGRSITNFIWLVNGMHSNARVGQSQRSTILGLNSCVQ